MKASDAKNPKFDSAWWKTNKAKAADADGGFEKLLKQYEAQRKTFQDAAKAAKGVASDDLTKTGRILQALKAEAAKKKNDPKLGALQKETKEALEVYEKKADAAMKAIQRFGGSPMMTMKTPDLVRHSPQFKTFCAKRFASENYDFLVAINAKKFDGSTYAQFVKAGASDQINIDSDIRGKFDAVAAAIKADPATTPDSPATWKRAPWKEATEEIVKVSDKDLVPGFRLFAAAQQFTRELP